MQWSLEDIYKKQVRGNIPRRKHLSVLGEAQVEITFDDGNKKASGGWDSKDAQFLLSQKLNTIYTNTIQLANAEVRREFYEQVAELTAQNNGKLENRHGATLKSHILREALNKGKVSNIYTFLNAKLGNRFPLLVGVDSLKQIGEIAFAESAVGVGPGEALLTLFTEGENPATGDIVLPNGDEVELKGAQGRPGKAMVAKLVRSFEDYAAGAYIKEEIPPVTIKNAERGLEEIEKIGNEVLEDYKAKGRQLPASITSIISIVQDKQYSVEDKAIKLYKKLGAGYWGDVSDIIALGDLVYQNNAKASRRAKDFFRSADEDTLIEGLSHFSSQPNVAVPIIRRGLEMGRGRDIEDVALAIAMTFQITEYHNELPEKFVYYTLFNQGDGLLVTWGPFTDDYEENANRTLENIMNSFDSVKIGADSGGRTGYNLTIGQ